MILVTGFGPFGDVRENPSGALARAASGLRAGDRTLLGLELPVSYRRGIELTVRVARAIRPALVLGCGVAARRERAAVERTGRARVGVTPDVDGQRPSTLEASGPALAPSTLDVERLAACLGVDVSEDAGDYVCNGWLYRVSRLLSGVPVGFLHIPRAGLTPERLRAGLEGFLGAGG
jgi:pyroglutamyl-peptidase